MSIPPKMLPTHAAPSPNSPLQGLQVTLRLYPKSYLLQCPPVSAESLFCHGRESSPLECPFLTEKIGPKFLKPTFGTE